MLVFWIEEDIKGLFFDDFFFIVFVMDLAGCEGISDFQFN
jgi:hypothetical protein